VLSGIPDIVGSVSSGSFISKLFLSVTDTSAVAVIGTDGSLAGNTVVSSEALAFSGLSVAKSLVTTFNASMSSVGSSSNINPGGRFGASSQGAIVFSPGGVRRSGSGVTGTFIVSSARSVSGATIGAPGSGNGDKAKEGNNSKLVHFE